MYFHLIQFLASVYQKSLFSPLVPHFLDVLMDSGKRNQNTKHQCMPSVNISFSNCLRECFGLPATAKDTVNAHTYSQQMELYIPTYISDKRMDGWTKNLNFRNTDMYCFCYYKVVW